MPHCPTSHDQSRNNTAQILWLGAVYFGMHFGKTGFCLTLILTNNQLLTMRPSHSGSETLLLCTTKDTI